MKRGFAAADDNRIEQADARAEKTPHIFKADFLLPAAYYPTVMTVKAVVVAARNKKHAGHKPRIIDKRAFYHSRNDHKSTPLLLPNVNTAGHYTGGIYIFLVTEKLYHIFLAVSVLLFFAGIVVLDRTEITDNPAPHLCINPAFGAGEMFARDIPVVIAD